MRLVISKGNKYVIINLNEFNGMSVIIKKAHERIKRQGHQLLNAKRDLSVRCYTSSVRCYTSSVRCYTSTVRCYTSSVRCYTSSVRCYTSWCEDLPPSRSHAERGQPTHPCYLPPPPTWMGQDGQRDQHAKPPPAPAPPPPQG